MTAQSGPNTTTAERLQRIMEHIPPDARLHGYSHSWGLTVQAEWVEEGQIVNPVILRIPFSVTVSTDGPVEVADA